MAQIPKGSLVKGPHKPICRDCAIYFSTTVPHPIYLMLLARGTPNCPLSQTEVKIPCGIRRVAGDHSKGKSRGDFFLAAGEKPWSLNFRK